MKTVIPLTIIVAVVAAPAVAQKGDPVLGARQFLQCRACHSDVNTVGPNLNGVVGAKAGTKAGYVYSPALAKSGIVWKPAELDAFITRPSQKMPGTKMAFGGVADAAARRNLIAYLATLKKK